LIINCTTFTTLAGRQGALSSAQYEMIFTPLEVLAHWSAAR